MRVVVGDDSPTARHLLVTLLSDDPAIEVVGEACNGAEALELTRRLRPDLVVIDYDMPVMDGLETTRAIMTDVPTPVLIVTAAAVPGVDLSARVLQSGALALLPKPAGPGDPAFRDAAQRLVLQVKALSAVKVIRRRRPAGEADTRPKRAEIVAIAASTGGPAALHRFLGCLPSDVTTPFLVVQHIAEGFTRGLVAHLGSGTSLRVKIAEHGEPLVAGTVYVGAHNRHLEMNEQRTIVLSAGPPVSGFRPSATVLFRSVASACGTGAVAVLLTGMGSDGFDGAVAVKEMGGRVFAQDEATSIVFGMPGAVVAGGLADAVGTVEMLAGRCS